MEARRLNDGSHFYFDGHSMMQSYELGSGVLLHVRRGVMTIEFAELVRADCDRQLRSAGRCVLMADGFETKRHTTEYRETMTDWFRLHENAVVHVLVNSVFVQMALDVAKLALRGERAKVYSDVAEWEAAGRRELPSFARRPLSVPVDLRSARG